MRRAVCVFLFYFGSIPSSDETVCMLPDGLPLPHFVLDQSWLLLDWALTLFVQDQNRVHG